MNNRLGILLHSQNAVFEKISAFLKDWHPAPYWGKIQSVQAKPQTISRLIPRELQMGAESWLILYRMNFPQELLILPYPEGQNFSVLTDTKRFGGYLMGLLEYIYGGNNNWFPNNGFRNLIEYEKREKSYPFPHPPPPKRFQVIRYDTPLDDLLHKPEIQLYEGELQESVSSFNKASESVQQSRDELLTSVLRVKNEEEARRLIQNFETSLLVESSRLSGRVGAPITPLIVNHFDIMDDETRRFLISAETIANFASKRLPEVFDFSLCGCGLWKAVERELNSSLMWYLRRVKNIAGNDRKPIAEKPHADANYEAGSKTVNINERERGSPEFEGIMLGDIKYLLRSAHDNNIADEIKPALENDRELYDFILSSSKNGLAYLIGQVANIRNGHAHIKPMKEQMYQDLHSLILSPENMPRDSLLGKILLIKYAMVKHFKA